MAVAGVIMSPPVDVLALTLRYIVSRKVAIVSLFFIMVGVMANIVVQAVMDGFQERIKSHLRGTESDLNFWVLELPADHFARVQQKLADEMSSRGGPIEALAPHHFALGIVGNQQVRPGFWPEDQDAGGPHRRDRLGAATRRTWCLSRRC